MKLPNLKPRKPGLRSTLHVALAAAAAVPFSAALLAHSGRPTAQPALQRAEARPALAFDQYMVNYGPIEPRDVVAARFGFTNRGGHPVTVRELKPSCGCLRPYLSKRTFQPGESGEFYLRVRTANEEPGPREYFVNLLYEDPKPRSVRLTFKVVLPERQVTVRPKALVFYQLGHEPTTREVIVTDYRGQGLQLMDVATTSELVSARIGPAENTAGIQRFRVLVTVAGTVPAGRHQARLTLRTNDPEFPELQVPLLIQGSTAGTPRSARHDGNRPNRR